MSALRDIANTARAVQDVVGIGQNLAQNMGRPVSPRQQYQQPQYEEQPDETADDYQPEPARSFGYSDYSAPPPPLRSENELRVRARNDIQMKYALLNTGNTVLKNLLAYFLNQPYRVELMVEYELLQAECREAGMSLQEWCESEGETKIQWLQNAQHANQRYESRQKMARQLREPISGEDEEQFLETLIEVRYEELKYQDEQHTLAPISTWREMVLFMGISYLSVAKELVNDWIGDFIERKLREKNKEAEAIKTDVQNKFKQSGGLGGSALAGS